MDSKFYLGKLGKENGAIHVWPDDTSPLLNAGDLIAIDDEVFVVKQRMFDTVENEIDYFVDRYIWTDVEEA